MKKLPTCILAATLAAPSALAAPVQNAPADIKAITAVELDIDKNLDFKEVIHHYAENAIAFDLVAPGVYKGRQAIYNGFAPLTDQIQSLKTFALPELNIVSDGTMACAASDLHLDMAMKSGATLPLSFRQLDVYRKIAGQWQVIQQQVSVPMDPKTGMAVMDEAPEARGAMQYSGDLFAGPAVSPAAARSQIRQWTVAAATALTAASLTTLVGPGADFLSYDEAAPGELRGATELADHYAAALSQAKSANVTLRLFTEESDGVFGAQSSVQHLVVTLSNGATQTYDFRQTDCLHRANGHWVSFMEELSFPMDMKTGKSVITAPPG